MTGFVGVRQGSLRSLASFVIRPELRPSDTQNLAGINIEIKDEMRRGQVQPINSFAMNNLLVYQYEVSRFLLEIPANTRAHSLNVILNYIIKAHPEFLRCMTDFFNWQRARCTTFTICHFSSQACGMCIHGQYPAKYFKRNSKGILNL
jgi:hypothetical protein